MGRKQLYIGSFFDYFTIIFDSREQSKERIKFMDVLFIAVAAALCGCYEWEEMEQWATVREA